MLWGNTPPTSPRFRKNMGSLKNLIISNGTLKDLECARLKQSVSYSGPEGFTPLYLATLRNQQEIVKKLLEHGTQLNQSVPSGLTPLNAAALADNYGLTVLFLQNVASMTGSTNFYHKLTSLALAINNNNKQVVHALVETLPLKHVLKLNLFERIRMLRIVCKCLKSNKEFLIQEKYAHYKTLLETLESEESIFRNLKNLYDLEDNSLFTRLPEEIWLRIGSYIIGKKLFSKNYYLKFLKLFSYHK